MTEETDRQAQTALNQHCLAAQLSCDLLRAAMEEQFAKFAAKYGHKPHWGRSMLLNWGEPA